ncbi:MAG: type II secretion system F family protein [Candidatus Omnitrophica bacterium]|jgi:type II secretory pathway component PulF|nr:type II secretion system F family protein [Candidatus Omnitrophota bacterium]
MPRYKYSAKSGPGKAASGIVDAQSQQDAIDKLAQKGLYPISIIPEETFFIKDNFLKVSRISKKDIVQFTTQLSSLVGSGVNIINGISIIGDQSPNQHFKIVLRDIASKIKDGIPLSEALSKHKELFPAIYVSMVHSGEVGGTLDKTLSRLATFLEKEEEFKSSIKGALIYPAFVFCVGVLTIGVLMGFVIPRLVVMFDDMGQALPVPTRILIDSSQMLRQYWWMALGFIALVGFVLYRYYQSDEGRMHCDKLKLKVFIFGDIILKSEISRMMRTLSLLISSGVTIVPALDISASLLDNKIIKAEILKVKDDISEGKSLSNSIKDSKLFPPLIMNVITVGEESGTLEKALVRISDDYEKEVDSFLKTISKLVEPAVILFMGLVVGFIVISMLLPIFQINLIVR